MHIQMEGFCITCHFSLMFLSYFILLKLCLKLFYLINSLFKKTNVQKITQVGSIKAFKISYFSSTFKLNERKVVLKSMVLRSGYKKIFAKRGFDD